MSRPLVPLREAKWVPQRSPGYDAHLDEVVHVCWPVADQPRVPMTRWQLFLIGCGIQPDAFDPVGRCYVPRSVTP